MSDQTRTDSSPAAGPSRSHVVAATVAILLSMGLHAFLFSELPLLRMGILIAKEKTARFRPFELERRPPPAPAPVKEPARFQPQDPNQLREIFGEAQVSADLAQTDLPVPEAPDVPSGPMTAQDKALVSPALPTTHTPWEPRQDIIQVQDRLYADEVSALPRRLTENVTRSPVAPDVVLPAEVSEISLAGGYGSGTGEGGTLSVTRSLASGAVAGIGSGGRTSAPAMSEDLFPGETTAFDEDRSKITGLEPTEHFLSVDVSTFAPPDEPDSLYFQVSIARQAEQALPVLPKDVLLLQDCSESMTAWKLMECKAGLRRWLDQLREGDRLELIGFRDAPYACFGHWMEYNEWTRAKALRFIDDMRAQGNTDVYASLAVAQQMERDPARPFIAAMITDGRPTVGTTDSSDIIESFTQLNKGSISMFSFGAGRRVNRFLLDLLSYRNRGDSLVVVDTDRIPYNMENWSKETARPVLIDLSYQFSGLDESQVYPGTLTHLYLDRPLVIFGRTERRTERTAFQVVGNSGSQKRDLLFELDLAHARAGSADIRNRWVWHKVYDLIGQFIKTRRPEVWREITSLAARYQLDIPYGKDLGIQSQ